MDFPGLCRERCKFERGARRGEVDNTVRLGEQWRSVAGQLDAVLGKTGKHARIPADQRRAGVLEGARKLKLPAVGDRLDQRTAHPSAGAGDHKPHFGHGTTPGTWRGYSARAGKRRLRLRPVVTL